MSADVMTFMIPAINKKAPHSPGRLHAAHFADHLDGKRLPVEILAAAKGP